MMTFKITELQTPSTRVPKSAGATYSMTEEHEGTGHGIAFSRNVIRMQAPGASEVWELKLQVLV